MPQQLKHGLTNLRGQQVGDLTIIQRVRSVPSKTGTKKRPRWRCICVCGKRVVVSHNRLIDKNNPKTHCGCKNQGLPVRFKKEYHAWWDAKQRCHDLNHPSYPRYGAHGIQMCEVWRESFEVFLSAMGPRPSVKHSLDRIDAHGNYEPGNVRWATGKEQARNKKETRFIKHPKTGKPTTIGDLADELGITYHEAYKTYVQPYQKVIPKKLKAKK